LINLLCRPLFKNLQQRLPTRPLQNHCNQGVRRAAGNILPVGRASRPVRIDWDGPGDPSSVG
jgi:hypothetical protein